MWNRSKAAFDKLSNEAWEARIAQLEAAYHEKCSEGRFWRTCTHDGCNNLVVDEDASYRKDSYFCHDHIEGARLGIDYGVPGTRRDEEESGNLFYHATLRSLVTPAKGDDSKDRWILDVDADTRNDVVKEFAKAIKSWKNQGSPSKSQPRFLSKKRSEDIFHIRKASVSTKELQRGANHITLFPGRKLGKLRLRGKSTKSLRKALADGKLCDCKVKRDGSGRWYLILVQKVPAKESSPIWESQSYRDAFLDPGARTFQTYWCPDGVAGQLGDGFYDMIKPLLLRADRAISRAQLLRNREQSVAAGLKSRQLRRRRKRAIIRAQRLRHKVYDSVRDLHRKAGNFLCSNFRAIFIGNTDGQSICSGDNRIVNDCVRNMMTFAHSEFRNWLADYAKARGVHVFVVGEGFTTKTCTGCGDVQDRGSVKVITCQPCGLVIGRDYAGARNIGLKTAMA